MLGPALLPLRTAALVGVTLGMYGLLEVETAVTDRAKRGPLLSKWQGRYGHVLVKLYGVEVAAAGPHVEAGARYPGADARGVGRIFVMNHRSGLDILVTLGFFDATIVSRADLAKWPLVGMAARRAGTLFVDRESKRSGATVLHAMASAVKAGRGVMIFPEGTTYVGDDVRPFKPGAFQTAHRTGAEVVPVGLAYEGDDVAFADEPFLAHMRRVSATPRTRAALVVGEPLLGTDGGGPDLGRRAHEAVQALVHRARATLVATSSRRT